VTKRNEADRGEKGNWEKRGVRLSVPHSKKGEKPLPKKKTHSRPGEGGNPTRKKGKKGAAWGRWGEAVWANSARKSH